jgi:hypothetical protein
MKTFKDFITEEKKELHLNVDNPGGDWLKGKQDYAEEQMKSKRNKGDALGKGITNCQTANFRKDNDTTSLNLPVEHLSKLRGAMDEHKTRDDESTHKNEKLNKEIGDPSNFDSEKHPISISVNHKGEGFVMEGNHRLAYAKRHGISHIHARVNYRNGGEEVEGHMHPSKLMKLHKEED